MAKKEQQAEPGNVSRASVQEQIERVVRGEHAEPSAVLGPHWVERDGGRALAIRAFRPNAVEASVVWSEETAPRAMVEIQSGGVFEVDPGVVDGGIGVGAWRKKDRSGLL